MPLRRMRALAAVAVALAFAHANAPLGRADVATTPNAPKALLIDIKGAIGFVSTAQLSKALEKAKAEHAGALILRLDTPGGLLNSTRDMIQMMLASPVPVVVFVAPSGARAASAGTYLTYASHIAAMAPGTHLGAATPIALGVPGLPGAPPPSKPDRGPEKEKSTEPEPSGTLDRKVLNDAVAYLRTLAELRNRNADWAEKAVREAATLTANDALKERVIEVIAADVTELMSTIDGRMVTTTGGEVRLATRGTAIDVLEADWKMRFLSAVAEPDVAFILLLIGLYGIFFEFMSPGAVAPGVIGGVSLLVALTALSVLPVNFGGLALLVLGIALMVMEHFTPSFGTLGLGGLFAFVLGAVFLFDPAQSDIQLKVAWPLIAGAAAVSVVFLASVLGFAVKARHRAVRTGPEEMIGSIAKIVAWQEGTGQVLVHGEIWAAQSSGPLVAGQEVRVVARSGLTLKVEAAS
jgi:membrane-bound serine protease (ClpP class)